MPFFSVIIPLYNKAENIGDTLNSVLEQSFNDFEIILIDDGSTDNGLQIVQTIIDPRLHVFSKTNEGVSLARNYGVSKAQGKFVAFLDADDIWKPNHLEVLYSLIGSFPNNKWFATRYEVKHHNGLISPMETHLLDDNASFEGIVFDYFKYSLVSSLAWTSAVCMSIGFFHELGGFDQKITFGAGEDTDLWIRAALDFPLVFSHKITAQHNLMGVNRISKTATEKRDFIDLDKYESKAIGNPYLKKYLDLNRFSIGLQYKMAGFLDVSRTYFARINKNNLSGKQRFLLSCNRATLLFVKKFQWFLRGLKINLSAFD